MKYYKHVIRLAAGGLTVALVGLICSLIEKFESVSVGILLVIIAIATIYIIGALVISFINEVILGNDTP